MNISDAFLCGDRRHPPLPCPPPPSMSLALTLCGFGGDPRLWSSVGELKTQGLVCRRAQDLVLTGPLGL